MRDSSLFGNSLPDALVAARTIQICLDSLPRLTRVAVATAPQHLPLGCSALTSKAGADSTPLIMHCLD